MDIVRAQKEQTVSEVGGKCWEIDITAIKNFDKKNYFELVPKPATNTVDINLHMQKVVDISLSTVNSQRALI